jgi:galactosamine-6-phosphate isomerase
MSDSPSGGGLRVVVADDYEDMSRRAAELIVDELRRAPSTLLCAAAGSSPTRAYELLAERQRVEPGLFDALTVVKLDEWVGLGPDVPGTCEEYLRRHLLEPLGVTEDRYIAFRGDAPDPEAECERVGRLLEERGPIGVSVLGLGVNGHLGFNEPADEIDPLPHVAELSEASRAHPMVRHVVGGLRFGLTLGLADVLRSRRALLLVSGRHKREGMAKLLARRVSTHFPASFLWLHRDAVCLCDAEAIGNHE